MCGIVGVLMAKDSPAIAVLYDALLAMQHRGQDAAGIVTEDHGRLCLRKDNGMVRDVFGQEHIAKLLGDVGIGHVRYPTAGSSCSAEAQPFYVNSPFGISLGHNGNLVNADALKTELISEWRHLNTGSDSEALLNIMAAAIMESLTERLAEQRSPSSRVIPGAEGEMLKKPSAQQPSNISPSVITNAEEEDVLHSVKVMMRRCIGGFAVVAMITGWGIVAFRDPHGIRPLAYGRRRAEGVAGDGPADYEYMVVSESGGLNALGFETVADVPAGHALLLQRGKPAKLVDCLPEGPRPPLAPCLFEYVYFARPDSVLDGVSVYRTRLRMGEKLAGRIKTTWPDHDIDVVIPVPDTSRTAALECAAALGIKYREGFIKNRYIGRTFIMPQQGLRRKSVRQKLSPIQSEFVGRNVLLVDDSIVRGTTCSEIVQMAREAGAKRVYIASAAPPVRFPNVYGIDMPTKGELVATSSSGAAVEDLETHVASAIAADRVIYQDLKDLLASITEEAELAGVSLSTLDSSCFNGKYVTDFVGESYLTQLARTRTSDRGSGTESTAMHLLDTLEIPKKARVR
mmetsp:Transcript_43399/g.86809  ORF Transcript_43399/g.86809 Transcript_43399/m.86809 type:complete len:570 (-) Transcript_43399:572-2281(-)